MIKPLLVSFFLFWTIYGYSQQSYFVLIQSDNNQAFFAKINNKTYTSSDIGHLVIPQLTDSIYTLIIGFPKMAYPDQKFTLALNHKEAGYQLKNLGDKGWALYNWQTLVLNMSEKTSKEEPQAQATPQKKADPFSKLMAGVVNDTTVMYNNYTDATSKKEPPPAEPAKPRVQKTDSSQVAAAPPVVSSPARNPVEAPANTLSVQTTTEKNNPAENQNQPKPSATVPEQPRAKVPENTAHQGSSPVEKVSEQTLDTALLLIYIDKGKNNRADTIIAIIPTAGKERTTQPAPTGTAPASVPSPSPSDTAGKTNQGTTLPATGRTEEKPVNPTNCKSVATDYDVDKLRVKLMSEENLDDKIDAAKKIFKSKCFSAKQVLALSEAFSSDESRYALFESVYPYTSDPENFPKLVNLLTADYYIKRFNAMLK